jgi:hypothetical protein
MSIRSITVKSNILAGLCFLTYKMGYQRPFLLKVMSELNNELREILAALRKPST